jgi:serine/threonine protein kinase
MGAVYRATDRHFERACAVKEMLDYFTKDEDREQALQWFKREALLLLDLHHPAIPRVFDYFSQGDQQYLVMDFIEGRTLAEVLKQEGKPHGLPEARVRSWATQLCNVLAYLHNLKPPVIFRDLKPANIMVTGEDRVKLIDFGIARSFQEGGQATVIMTVGYAPPEQMEGRPQPQSDLYALGATLHRLLTGHEARENKPSVFDFPSIRSLRPEINPQFEAVIFKALKKEMSDRWASAREMEQALLQLPPLSPTEVS